MGYQKKMQFVSIASTIKCFKLPLTVQSHTCTVSEYLNYAVPYLHNLETITLNRGISHAVWDFTTYLILPSF